MTPLLYHDDFKKANYTLYKLAYANFKDLLIKITCKKSENLV